MWAHAVARGARGPSLLRPAAAALHPRPVLAQRVARVLGSARQYHGARLRVARQGALTSASHSGTGRPLALQPHLGLRGYGHARGMASAAGGKGEDDGEEDSGGSGKRGKKRRSARPKTDAADNADTLAADEVVDSAEDPDIGKHGKRRRQRSKRNTAIEKEDGEHSEQMVEALVHGTPSRLTIPGYYPEVAVIRVRRPIFPNQFFTVETNDPEVVRKIKFQVDMAQPFVGAFTPAEADSNGSGGPVEDGEGAVLDAIDSINAVGTFCDVVQMIEATNGGLRMILRGHRRIRAVKSVGGEDCFVAEVENVRTLIPPIVAQEFTALFQEVRENCLYVAAHNAEYKAYTEQLLVTPKFHSDPEYLCDMVGTLTGLKRGNESSAVLQKMLDAERIEDRLRFTLELLEEEKLVIDIRMQVAKEVEEKVNKSRKEYILREQLETIKKELGMSKDEKATLVTTFTERLKSLTPPEAVAKVIEEEFEKLSTLETSSSEFSMTRNYLDWLTSVPWGKLSTDLYDISSATTILDDDHYGMKDVKERILEFIAVGSLLGTVQGKIVCFVGPPGVGKTSIASSIARALGREMYRFSVGGLSDVAEIKGHRRTYVGAMPGKPVQCLKKTATQNPLILIDEIDKLGRGYQGDPTSALLELFDPEQNDSFMDHYLDVPVDMSKALFICTANTLDTIPGPLLDRMEVIELSGYMAEEKTEIAKRYLMKKAVKESGIPEADLLLSDGALSDLIRWYCRESGVRTLQKKIEKIYRKAALLIAKGTEVPIHVTQESLKDFVGRPIFTSDRLYETTPPGIVMGLAWTSMGGATLYIETVAKRLSTEGGTPRYSVTGQLGDVMKESTTIAATFTASFLNELEPSNRFLEEHDVSMHVPEGATPKDGPSAGCTMTTALLSLALNKPVKQNLAMTGEISLTGKILPVGGIKEKLLAARRSGVTEVILPEGTRAAFDDLQPEVTDGLTIHFVSHYREIYSIAFDD